LLLLIVHYERERQQYALHSGTEEIQAAVATQIAQIYLRRERYVESRQEYEEALRLFAIAGFAPHNAQARAFCHHQLGNLWLYRFEELDRAEPHYKQALALFDQRGAEEEDDPAPRALCALALKEIENRKKRHGASFL
jgi:tetratricopeptide (TPR) repeat protein